jgi:soluble lytic murein transglycosylase-like protein
MPPRGNKLRRYWKSVRLHPALAASVTLLCCVLAIALWRSADPLRAYASANLEQRIVLLREPIRAAAQEAGLDPYILAGLVATESSGRPGAKSSAGALGLTQLKLDTAAEQARLMQLPAPSERDLLTDPGLNLRLGAGYLARLVKRQGGSLPQALMAYNTGPTRFNQWISAAGGFEAWLKSKQAGQPPKPGTVIHYASKVEEWARRLRRAALLEAPAAQ